MRALCPTMPKIPHIQNVTKGRDEDNAASIKHSLLNTRNVLERLRYNPCLCPQTSRQAFEWQILLSPFRIST